MQINVTYLPQSEEVEVRGHDCLEDGHVMEETEFANEYIVWTHGNPDVEHIYSYGLVCKYCDYVEEDEDDEYPDD